MGVSSICLTILNMLITSKAKKKPADDKEQCTLMKGKGPKDIKWNFEKD